ncbi:MAG TPA: GGDEF domain-containing protein [Spirochaetota bacterium]|nr:GGDEF domain-containing protein [Spirochaetota bacterium]HOM10867.1 GGDEF domain-containing protein [Spirochaetota bacterium]HPP50276.1 GGDEF domain-containing protein [Spirochaetota bacterium]
MDSKEILKTVQLFSSLNDSELNIIQNYCRFKELKENEKLFDYDEDFKLLCIVTAGSIAIYSNGSSNRLIARYLPNESFGELNLCGITLGNAQAVALEQSSVLLFPSISFEDFITQHANIGAKVIYQLLSNISFRIRETNKLISQNYGWVSELKKAIYTDRLTGLYNRQYCEELLKENREYSIAVIKPDKFKAINDTCGHKAGDATLIALAQTIRKASPDAIHIRYRGDEFIVATPPDTDIQSLAQAILKAIGTINIASITSGLITSITASIGTGSGVFCQRLIDSVYERMWSVYHKGGNSIAVEGDM